MKKTLGKLSLLLAVLALIVAIDRVLFVRYGTPLWESDPILHYKHKPGATWNWGEKYDNKPIRINRHGFYDDDFPVKKARAELRGLVLGDSVVMGHGVLASESFANQLEAMLPQHLPGYEAYQVINAGVQGYSTFQHVEVLRRSMKFSPDFVVVGFCMNDVTEPYKVNQSYGGTGLDYHGILQAPHPWLAYLANDTGIGRVAIRLRMKLQRRNPSLQTLARQEIYEVRNMAENCGTDPVFIQAWASALRDLGAVYDLAARAGLPVVLVIFPHAFQIGNPALQAPQRILKQHAGENGVGYMDMTKIAESLLATGVALDALLLDRDHYTVRGHRLIAEKLLEHLLGNNLLQVPTDTTGGPHTKLEHKYGDV